MAFATSADVQVRLGRDLTDPETALADQVIDNVSELIIEAVNRDDDWADALDPVPTTLKVLCIEKALAAIVNPTSLMALSEQLGAYQHTDTYQRLEDGSALGVFLSASERRRVRKAIYKADIHTARMESIITPAFPRFADDDDPLPII